MSDSDTDSDSTGSSGIFMPNGYEDVGADLVPTDFGKADGYNPPPAKKKRGRRGTRASFDNSQESIPDSPCPPAPVDPEPTLVLDDDDDDDDDAYGDSFDCGTRRSKRISKGKKSAKGPKATMSSRNSSFSIDLNNSDSVVVSAEPSPEDFDLTAQSSFSFDVEEESPLPVTDDSNMEKRIRVVWKGCETRHFNIRQFQNLKEIYTYYAEREGIDENRILFTLRDKPVSPSDTPSSLSIGVSSLEGGVTDFASSNSNQKTDTREQDPNSIKLQVQRNGVKEKHSVYTLPHEKISVLISKLSEDLKIPYPSIKLMFDGDELSPDDTPANLDMEGDECIDLIVR